MKIAAVNNVVPIASGCVRAGADIVAIDKKSGECVLSEEDFQVELQEE